MIKPLTEFLRRPTIATLDRLIDDLDLSHGKEYAAGFVNRILNVNDFDTNSDEAKAYKLWLEMREFHSQHRLYVRPENLCVDRQEPKNIQNLSIPMSSASEREHIDSTEMLHIHTLEKTIQDNEDKISKLSEEILSLTKVKDCLEEKLKKIGDVQNTPRSKEDMAVLHDLRNRIETIESDLVNANEEKESVFREKNAALIALRDVSSQLDSERKKCMDLTAENEHLVRDLSTVNEEIQKLHSKLACTVVDLENKEREKVLLVEDCRKKIEGMAEDFRQAKQEMANELQAAKQEMLLAKKEIDAQNCAYHDLKQEYSSMMNLYGQVLPSRLLKIAGIDMKDNNSLNDGKISLLFSFLAILFHNPVEDAYFLERFRVFDKELYALFHKAPAVLANVREIYQKEINTQLKEHSVNWALVGEKYNDDIHYTDDSKGNRVIEVISAQITGPVHSQRATVRTA